MENEKELLKDIFENAEMGRDCLTKLMEICDDPCMKSVMVGYYSDFQNVINECMEYAQHLDIKLTSKKTAKAMALRGLKLNTLIDKTTSHIAEMLIQGSTIGIIDLKRSLRENGAEKDEDECTEGILGIANKLLDAEKNNVHGLLRFV